MPAPTKVHIRGLDNLTTEDLEAFASDHFPAHRRERLEWVDDTSANLVYATIDIAADALTAFSDPSVITDPTTSSLLPVQQLRRARAMAAHPDILLEIRQALTTDVKKQRARDASRFYLMNPDKDPNNRPRKGAPRKRRHGEDEEMAMQPFDESMYDDDPVAFAARNRRASDNLDSRQTKRARAGTARHIELFGPRPGRSAGKELFRARSASPPRELFGSGDGRYGFDAPIEEPEAVKPRGRAAGSAGKELFADRETGVLRNGNGTSSGRELFGPQSTPLKENGHPARELLGSNSRASSPFHRRTDAFDIDDRVSHNSPVLDERHARPRNLADRITGGPGSSSPSRGRGSRKFDPSEDQGSAMRGNGASSSENPGFQIKGIAKEMNPRVRELFPQKEGGGDNAGKELFGARPKRAPRRKAEDLFG